MVSLGAGTTKNREANRLMSCLNAAPKSSTKYCYLAILNNVSLNWDGSRFFFGGGRRMNILEAHTSVTGICMCSQIWVKYVKIRGHQNYLSRKM